jgi:hypothetical protein
LAGRGGWWGLGERDVREIGFELRTMGRLLPYKKKSFLFVLYILPIIINLAVILLMITIQ